MSNLCMNASPGRCRAGVQDSIEKKEEQYES